jgi:hypothetical protein
MNWVYMISIIKWLQVLEEEVYHALGLEWIPPEMRENKGEIGLAKKGIVMALVIVVMVVVVMMITSYYYQI